MQPRRLFLKESLTFIELALIMVIIGIIAAVVIPRVGRSGLFEKYEVYTAAHQVASDLRLTQRLAVTSLAQHRLLFFNNYTNYVIQRFGVNATWNATSVVKNISSGITVNVGVNDTNATFNYDGSSDADHFFNYSLAGFNYNVSVKMATGRVKVQ